MLKHVLKIDSQKAIFIAFILFFSYKLLITLQIQKVLNNNIKDIIYIIRWFYL